MRETIAQSISGEISATPMTSEPMPIIRISITTIISERYLYSLTREIVKQLSASIGTGVTLDPEYSTFDDVRIDGSDFVFVIGANQPIRISMSNYLFDIWHRRSESVLS
jgi:hypothetical protein